EWPQSEVVDDDEIRRDEAPQLAVKGVVRTRARQRFQQRVGADKQHTVSGTACGVTESLSQIGLADAHRSAEGDIFVTLDKVKSKQIHEPLLVDADFRGPI